MTMYQQISDCGNVVGVWDPSGVGGRPADAEVVDALVSKAFRVNADGVAEAVRDWFTGQKVSDVKGAKAAWGNTRKKLKTERAAYEKNKARGRDLADRPIRTAARDVASDLGRRYKKLDTPKKVAVTTAAAVPAVYLAAGSSPVQRVVDSAAWKNDTRGQERPGRSYYFQSDGMAKADVDDVVSKVMTDQQYDKYGAMLATQPKGSLDGRYETARELYEAEKQRRAKFAQDKQKYKNRKAQRGTATAPQLRTDLKNFEEYSAERSLRRANSELQAYLPGWHNQDTPGQPLPGAKTLAAQKAKEGFSAQARETAKKVGGAIVNEVTNNPIGTGSKIAAGAAAAGAGLGGLALRRAAARQEKRNELLRSAANRRAGRVAAATAIPLAAAVMLDRRHARNKRTEMARIRRGSESFYGKSDDYIAKARMPFGFGNRPRMSRGARRMNQAMSDSVGGSTPPARGPAPGPGFGDPRWAGRFRAGLLPGRRPRAARVNMAERGLGPRPAGGTGFGEQRWAGSYRPGILSRRRQRPAAVRPAAAGGAAAGSAGPAAGTGYGDPRWAGRFRPGFMPGRQPRAARVRPAVTGAAAGGAAAGGAAAGGAAAGAAAPRFGRGAQRYNDAMNAGMRGEVFGRPRPGVRRAAAAGATGATGAAVPQFGRGAQGYNDAMNAGMRGEVFGRLRPGVRRAAAAGGGAAPQMGRGAQRYHDAMNAGMRGEVFGRTRREVRRAARANAASRGFGPNAAGGAAAAGATARAQARMGRGARRMNQAMQAGVSGGAGGSWSGTTPGMGSARAQQQAQQAQQAQAKAQWKAQQAQGKAQQGPAGKQKKGKNKKGKNKQGLGEKLIDAGEKGKRMSDQAQYISRNLRQAANDASIAMGRGPLGGNNRGLSTGQKVGLGAGAAALGYGGYRMATADRPQPYQRVY